MSSTNYPSDQGQGAGAIPVYNVINATAPVITNLAVAATVSTMTTAATTKRVTFNTNVDAWITLNGATPSVGGANCILLPSQTSLSFSVAPSTTINLIQNVSGAAFVTVIEQ